MCTAPSRAIVTIIVSAFNQSFINQNQSVETFSLCALDKSAIVSSAIVIPSDDAVNIESVVSMEYAFINAGDDINFEPRGT